MEPLFSPGGRHKTAQRRKSAALTPFKALYPFTARNNEELSFEADDVIEVRKKTEHMNRSALPSLLMLSVFFCQVDEMTEREEGWLYGSKQGKMGWFPESYVERVTPSDMATNSSAPAPKLSIQSQLVSALVAAKAAGTKSAFTPTHSTNAAPPDTHGQVRGLKLNTFIPRPLHRHLTAALSLEYDYY